jgi:hypothetical protein
MAVGQVGFFEQKEVITTTVAQRENAIVNRLNKTKTEHTTESFKRKQSHLDPSQLPLPSFHSFFHFLVCV